MCRLEDAPYSSALKISSGNLFKSAVKWEHADAVLYVVLVVCAAFGRHPVCVTIWPQRLLSCAMCHVCFNYKRLHVSALVHAIVTWYNRMCEGAVMKAILVVRKAVCTYMYGIVQGHMQNRMS